MVLPRFEDDAGDAFEGQAADDQLDLVADRLDEALDASENAAGIDDDEEDEG